MSQVQLPDFKMHYMEQGGGDEAVVFVHGFVSSHRWWQPALAHLPASYHAYAIDLRASGGSEAVETGHTLAQYAEDIEAFAAVMGLEKFTLVGHSMGGGVAMQYALSHPERIKALVLVDPLSPFGMRLDQAATDWTNSVQGQEEGQRLIVLGAFATPPTGDYLEQLVDDAVAWDKPIYLGCMDDMAKFNVSEQLSSINVPTLLTWGDKDVVIPFAGIVDAFTKIPNCSLEIWHGVGHSGPIEIPERFVGLLTGFIEEAGQAQE
ncbi:MAG: alpha/beta hydrolase [Anaerolineaceae bacterium]|nr:MAG: alpha/beta hydrolase [Anaerolineaceae bacterium]